MSGRLLARRGGTRMSNSRERRHMPRWCLAAAIVACVVLGAGIAVADIPDGNTINACRNNTTFALRVIDKDASQSCTSGETALSWTNWRWRGAWTATPSPAYAVGDAVSYLGSSYLATAVPAANPPTNIADWGVLAAAGLGTPQLSKSQIARLRWDQNPARGAKYTVGSEPNVIAFDGTNIWVTNFNSGSVSKIVPTTGVVTTPVTGLSAPVGIAFDGTNLWVANLGSGSVSQISTAGTVLHTVTGLSAPEVVAFDGTKIWVTDNGSNTVSRINPAGTPAVDATVTVGTRPTGIVFDGTHLWVVNSGSNTVTEINPATATTVGSPIAVGAQGTATLPAFDGANVWVPNETAGTVSKINVATATVTATITIGTGTKPDAAAFDGTHVWIANNGSNTVSKIDPTTNTVITGGDGFSGTGGMAYNGSDMWIANAASNTVVKVPAP